jgi:translation initiation factor IF-3
MDYGRFKFEALKREKESRREHNVVRLKEMKLRPKISEHDFQTKFGYVRHFLQEGDKVKLTIMFRGREMVHQEYGRRLLDRMANELKEVATIERNPLVEGRNMIMIMSPLGKKQPRGPLAAAEAGSNRHPAEATTTTTTTTTANDEAPSGGPSTNGSTSSDAQDQNPQGNAEALPGHPEREGDAPPRVDVPPAREEEPEA